VIEVSATRNTHYMHQSALTFVGDIRHSLAALGAGLAGQSQWTAAGVADLKRAIAAIYRADEEWGPAAIVDVARAELPDNTVASVDSGA
ncbi:hypothetical protein ACR6JC_24280, partial [Citrobacter europaeus]|uniref:hypothetical protein n=1 Tax=Citrobacter europaeus TaxID=1914243 RepID=UPI003EDAB8CC